jgi:transcriptional regulator with GAF, ATPase, and Fis domain
MIRDDETAALMTAMHLQVTRAGDTTTTVSRVLRALVQGLGAVSAALTVLTDHDASRAVVVAAVNLPALPPGTRLTLDHTVLGHVAAHDAATLFHGSLGENASLVPQSDCAHSVCWPLRFHSGRRGALTVHRGARAATFDSADLQRGAVITTALSMLMESARLNHQMDERNSRLIAIHRELQATNQELMAALVCAANELKTTPAEVTRQAHALASASERLTWIPKAVFLQDPSR